MSKTLHHRLKGYFHTATRWPSDESKRLALAETTAGYCEAMGVLKYGRTMAEQYSLTEPNLVTLYYAAKRIIVEGEGNG